MKLFERFDAALKEAWEERSAIREFDAGYSRDEAERLAYEEIRRKVDSDKSVQK